MESSKIETTKLSLPKGGGAIQGIGETFQPQEFTGTSGLSIPVMTSPCRGFEPQLTVDYSSGAGNGIFGLGFDLSIPKVSRKTSKGLPLYDGTDTFILSNADDLIPTGSEEDRGEYKVIAYRPRTEGLFAKIEQWINRGTGESYWQVTGRENITSRYGKTPQARISDPENANHVFEWLLEESFDAKGNYIVYTYKQENTQGVPQEIYEENRTQTANKYIYKIQYGNDQPLQPGGKISSSNVWHFEVIFDYGDREINLEQGKTYSEIEKKDWTNRLDPFSTYHAGFEIRTHRLCRQILMFHRFAELHGEPVLVHGTRFHYREDPNITLLTAVEAIGYRYESGQYQTKSLPPLEFKYTEFQPQGHEFEPFLQEGKQFLPGLISSGYQIIDLYGEGIPGVLYNDGTATRYWEPAGNDSKGPVMYNGPQQPLSLPIAYGKTNNQQLIDLTGNGQLDLVLSTPNVSGYYEVKGDRTWQGFQTFPAFTNEFLDPDSQLTDITGDGLLDLLRLEGDRVKVYPGKGKAGFGSPIIQHFDPPLTPPGRGTRGDRTETLQFADIFGTGRQHLVRIRNGAVECWPSLGYGKFGKKVTLGNAPSFGEDFDISRLFLADIDGSGTADILYVKSDRVLIWFNQSGNSFSEPLSIPLLGGARGGSGQWDNLDQISFADVFGNGTTCMVFSESHIQPRHWCYDFCQRTKPHLLNQTDNNLGATTRITYGTSTKYYLEDKQKGRPWITNLPFPVQVIEKVESWDAISQTKLVSSYSYHHGYYDGEEREFFGFGMVERCDAETLSSDAEPYDVPPVLSKTWYHTGAWQGPTPSPSQEGKEGPTPSPSQEGKEESLSKQYEPEYFQGDPDAHQFPDSVFDANGQEPDSETWREAHRALKGMVLREELYALDDSAEQAYPYTVTQTNYRVKLIQPKGENKYGVYFVHPQESLTYDYERNPDDPRMGHEFVLEVDEYGNVLGTCAVAYGRRGTDGLPEQLSLKITYSADSFINETDSFYLLGVPKENCSYEIKNLSLPAGQYFAFAEVKDYIEGVADSADTPLLSWQRHYYWNPEKEESFPFGEVSPQALPYRSEIAEFSPEQVEMAFNGALNKADLDSLLENEGKYVLADNYWWNQSSTQAYNAADQFYLPQATTDPFGNATRYEYDDYNLLVIKVTDALNNETIVDGIDYQTLQPQKMRDINHNISEVLFDPLGMVTVTSYYGTDNGEEPTPNPSQEGNRRGTGGEQEGNVGFMKLEDYQQQEPPTTEEVIANPRTYLQGAASYFHYDLFSWKDRQIPVHAVNLVAEDYKADARVQRNITYSDGLGREVQSKMKVEAGEAFVVNADGSIGTEITQDRWLTSNRKVYNNKGNTVKEYEPYYIKGYEYVDNEELNRFGVSPTLFYDPLQRLVRVDTPKGFFTKVEFTPWEERHYDENDTVVDSPYYARTDLDETEREALQKAEVFYDTPLELIQDNLGRTVQEIQINKNSDGKVTPLTTYYEWDIVGNQLSSADPRLSANLKNFQMTYSMTNEVLTTVSVDTGTRWQLNNVLGNPIYSRDSRNFEVRTAYDELQRPVQVHVRDVDGATQLDQVVERLVYGESADVDNPENLNLRGQVYKHYDQAGLLQVDGYNILGAPLTTNRQLREEYKEEANWDNTEALQSTIYQTQSEYDALGRVTAQTDADDNVYTPTYHESGRLNQIQVQHQGEAISTTYVESIDYNSKGQRTKIVYGNGVTTDYEYEATTFRLTRILTQRGAALAAAPGKKRGATPHWLCRLLPQFLRRPLGRVLSWGWLGFKGRNSRAAADFAKLQDLNYTYDPVGNITQIADNAWETVFNNNQQVEPKSTYTYDALYRLIEATGREHSALSAEAERWGNFEEEWFVTPGNINNGQAVQNYTRRYDYDDGGNLCGIRHQGAKRRELVVSDRSNRAVENVSGSITPEEVDGYFDANGNQTRLGNSLSEITWNYRDNIASVTIIPREDAPDAEYYVYDGAGNRIRKVTERNDGTVIHIDETIYLGMLEIRQTRQNDNPPLTQPTPSPSQEGSRRGIREERRSLRVMDDNCCLATKLRWTEGTPPPEVSPSQVRYKLENHLSSAVMEVDDGGQIISYEEYFPYGGTSFVAGRSLAEVKLKQYRYSCKERDASTGLYYYGARYYAPWLGRWMSCDPAGTVDGLNLYGFVGGNPVNFLDIGGQGKTDYSVQLNKPSVQRNTILVKDRKGWGEVYKQFLQPSVTSASFDIEFQYQHRSTTKRYKFLLNANMGNTKDKEKINYVHSDAGSYKDIVKYFDKEVDQKISSSKITMNKYLKNPTSSKYLDAKNRKEKYRKIKADIVKGIRRTLKGTALSKGIPKHLTQEDVQQILRLGTLIATSETFRSPIAPHIAIANLYHLKRDQFTFAKIFGTGTEKPEELGFIGAADKGADALRKLAEGKLTNATSLEKQIDEYNRKKNQKKGVSSKDFLEHNKKHFPHTMK